MLKVIFIIAMNFLPPSFVPLPMAISPCQVFEEVWKRVQSSFHRSDMNNVNWLKERKTRLATARKAKSIDEVAPVIKEMLKCP